MSAHPINLITRCQVCNKRFTINNVYAVPMTKFDLVICPACCQEAQPRDFPPDLPEKLLEYYPVFQPEPLPAVTPGTLNLPIDVDSELERQGLNNTNIHIRKLKRVRKVIAPRTKRSMRDIIYMDEVFNPTNINWHCCFDCDKTLTGRWQNYGSCNDCMQRRWDQHRARTKDSRKEQKRKFLNEK